MPSEGWKNIVGQEWASCILHNLPFFRIQKIKKCEKPTLSIYGCRESAANWNWYDFKEKGCLRS